VMSHLLSADRHLVVNIILTHGIVRQKRSWVVAEVADCFCKLSFEEASRTAVTYSIDAPSGSLSHNSWSSWGLCSHSSIGCLPMLCRVL
jgi:hypothetical protein